MDKNKYTIPMLEKALKLIEIVSDYPNGITMSELMQKTNLPKSNVYKILSSFVKMGYICKNENSSNYFLSKKMLSLGLTTIGEGNLLELALPMMKKLRDKIGESIMLGILINDRVVLVEQVLGSYSFTFFLRSGTSFNLYASAPGKLFVAYASEIEQKRLLNSIEYKQFNSSTIANKKEFIEEIKEIKKNGYAIDVEEEMYGVHCVAVPIFNQLGTIIATIWTSGPSGRLKKDDFSNVALKLEESAKFISSYLGYLET